jgi:hypothetical protein
MKRCPSWSIRCCSNKRIYSSTPPGWTVPSQSPRTISWPRRDTCTKPISKQRSGSRTDRTTRFPRGETTVRRPSSTTRATPDKSVHQRPPIPLGPRAVGRMDRLTQLHRHRLGGIPPATLPGIRTLRAARHAVGQRVRWPAHRRRATRRIRRRTHPDRSPSRKRHTALEPRRHLHTHARSRTGVGDRPLGTRADRQLDRRSTAVRHGGGERRRPIDNTDPGASTQEAARNATNYPPISGHAHTSRTGRRASCRSAQRNWTASNE